MIVRSTVFGPFVILLILAAAIAVYWPTYWALLSGDSSDVTHRIFVIPVFVALVWELRFELANLPMKPFWFGLLGIAGSGLVWLVGEIAFIRLLTEIAVIFMVPLAVLTLLGFRWLWALSFPLFYLLFAIPFRGPLVPLQVEWTAKFAYVGLLSSGIPVLREGPFFELPTGKWVVAEACSGIEYLSACLMLTVLFSWSMYTSLRKRLVFIVGGLLVGIGGNWLRAYLTIAIAHFSDNRFLRHGHGTFGWVLFAALLFTYCWIGWRFRDHEPAGGVAAQSAPGIAPTERRGLTFPVPRVIASLGVVVAMMGVWRGVSYAYLQPLPAAATVEIATLVPVGGWLPVAASPLNWAPKLVNPTAVRVQSFEKNGRRVDLFIGVFANQTWNSKLVSSVNQFDDPEGGRWSLVDRGIVRATLHDRSLDVRTGVLLSDRDRIMARQWYWVDGVSIGGDIRAKLEQLRARLSGHADVSAWVTIHAGVGSSPESATNSLDEFMRDMGLPLEQALGRLGRR